MQVFTVLLTFAGMAYGVIALWAARDFERATRAAAPPAQNAAPLPASVLKPVRGVDARMYAGLLSHCEQTYAGPYELLFGVSSLEDPAIRALRFA
jgi:ceramide glucosyltransferase